MNSSTSATNAVNRRHFLATSAAATAALCLGGTLIPRSAGAALPNRRRIPLDGAWQVAPAGTEEWIPATVPGCIHTDLLAAGKIPDPYYQDNEDRVQWIGEVDWIYTRHEMPVEVIAEFEQWRKIRDWQGVEGWGHQTMLSARRMIVVMGIIVGGICLALLLPIFTISKVMAQ